MLVKCFASTIGFDKILMRFKLLIIYFWGKHKMSIKSVLKICALLSAFTLSQNTFAGSYWGIGGGTSSWDIKPLFGSYEVKDGATFDALLGVRTGNFGYEGEITYSRHDWVGVSNATHNATNLILAGLGYLPLSQSFELYGKLGVDFWGTSVDFGGYNFEGDHGTSLVIGGGMNLNLSQSFSLRVEYKQMSGLGDGVDKGDISQTTVLAVFNL